MRCVGAILLAAMSSIAMGANCEWVYLSSFQSLPQSQKWTFQGSTASNASASSGVLVYGPAGTGSTTYWDADVPPHAMDFTKFDWSIEAEVRLTGATHGNVSGYRRGGFVLAISDKNGRWIIADIGSSRLSIRNDNTGTSDPQVNVDLASGFHVVRLTAGPTGGRLSVDGQQLLTMPLGTGNTPNRANFGDGSVLASATLTEVKRVQIIPAQEPCPGDVNCDTFVDDLDFVTFVYGYNLLDCSDPAMTPKCPADLNRDGIVDDLDFQLFVRMYDVLECFPG
ncbi:MAG: dockerin type I domain-containing protein [Phycisphaerales bacterium]|nr:hypothetical protein [Planctomycetota bacterium]